MVKCLHNISANKIEELVFYSDSEEQFVSDDSEIESTQDLSKHIDGIVATNEEWHEGRSEDGAAVHHFTASNPGLILVVATLIGIYSSSFDCFRLLFTDKLFSVFLTETNCDYQ
jgi:hypothetical protein